MQQQQLQVLLRLLYLLLLACCHLGLNVFRTEFDLDSGKALYGIIIEESRVYTVQFVLILKHLFSYKA